MAGRDPVRHRRRDPRRALRRAGGDPPPHDAVARPRRRDRDGPVADRALPPRRTVVDIAAAARDRDGALPAQHAPTAVLSLTLLAALIAAQVAGLAGWVSASGISAGNRRGLRPRPGRRIGRRSRRERRPRAVVGRADAPRRAPARASEEERRTHEERIARAREAERARIAQELHDVAAQHVAGLLSLTEAAVTIVDPSPAEALTPLTEARAEARFAAASLYAALNELRAAGHAARGGDARPPRPRHARGVLAAPRSSACACALASRRRTAGRHLGHGVPHRPGGAHERGQARPGHDGGAGTRDHGRDPRRRNRQRSLSPRSPGDARDRPRLGPQRHPRTRLAPGRAARRRAHRARRMARSGDDPPDRRGTRIRLWSAR